MVFVTQYADNSRIALLLAVLLRIFFILNYIVSCLDFFKSDQLQVSRIRHSIWSSRSYGTTRTYVPTFSKRSKIVRIPHNNIVPCMRIHFCVSSSCLYNHRFSCLLVPAASVCCEQPALKHNELCDTIRYDILFALKNWQASCQFNLAHELKEN